MQDLVFKITPQEIHIIAQALGPMPYNVVAPLIAKLDAQLAEQQRKPKLSPVADIQADGEPQPLPSEQTAPYK